MSEINMRESVINKQSHFRVNNISYVLGHTTNIHITYILSKYRTKLELSSILFRATKITIEMVLGSNILGIFTSQNVSEFSTNLNSRPFNIETQSLLSFPGLKINSLQSDMRTRL